MSFVRLHSSLRRGIGGLLAVNVFLSVVLMAVVAYGEYRAANPLGIVANGAGGVSSGPVEGHITKSEVASITTGRAVFRTGRIRKSKVVDELNYYQLKGTSTRGGQTRAYVRDNKRKKMLIKRVGDMIGSWEIVEIEKQRMTVQRGAEVVVVPKG